MPFNIEKFQSGQFKPRIDSVDVPTLKDFFDEGEKPVWEVRGLTAPELSRATAAKAMHSVTDQVVQSLRDRGGTLIQELREKMGLGDATPPEVAKRMEMLVMGSVSPEITLPIAVKLAEYFPIEFTVLTNRITQLTGDGFEYQKPQAALPKKKTS